MENFVATLVEFVNQIKELIKQLVESFRDFNDKNWLFNNVKEPSRFLREGFLFFPLDFNA